MQVTARLQRILARLHDARLSPLSRVVDQVVRLLFAASVAGRARMGRNVFFHHSGMGVVIVNGSVIKNDCEIGVDVVLGDKAPIRGAPHLERGVIIHAGARLIGSIRVGAGSIVAANAVVTKDVPPNCMVAGVPAEIKRRDIDSSLYRHDAPPIQAEEIAP